MCLVVVVFVVVVAVFFLLFLLGIWAWLEEFYSLIQLESSGCQLFVVCLININDTINFIDHRNILPYITYVLLILHTP